MAKKEKTSLDIVCETIQTAQVRLRIADYLPNPRMERVNGLGELIAARDTLDFEIEILSKQLALLKAKRKGPKRANHKNR